MNNIVFTKNNIKIEKSFDNNSKTVYITIHTNKIEELIKLIKNRFDLKCGEFMGDITGNQFFANCTSGKYKISIGYGEWFPFAILSDNQDSNQLVEEIFEWLQTIKIPI